MRLTHDQVIRHALKMARVESGFARFHDNRAVGDNKSGRIVGPHRQRHEMQTRISRMLAGRSTTSVYASVDEREENARFALDMMQGAMHMYLDRLPSETPEEFEDRPGKVTVPIAGAIIDTLARLYDGDTMRRGAPGIVSELPDEYAGWASDVSLDELYAIAERWLACQGNGAVRMLWSERDQMPVPEWVPAHQIRTIANPDDPSEPLAVIVRWGVPDADSAEVIEHATVYTAEEIVPLVQGEVDVESITAAGFAVDGPSGNGYANPYKINREGELVGVIPLALARYRRIGHDWHTDGEGQYLADVNAEINNLLTTAGYQAYMQGFTPVVAVNRDTKRPILWGPGRFIDIRANKGEQGGLSTVPLDSHISEIVEFVNQIIMQVLRAKRIPEQAVFATADASGVSIVAANTPLSEYRRSSQHRWRRIEQDAYVAWAAVQAWHNNEAPPNAWRTDLAVDWEEPQVAVAETERAMSEDRKMALGLISVIDIELRDNGDAYAEYGTDEERRRAALDALRARLEETLELRDLKTPDSLKGVSNEPAEDDDDERASADGEPEPGTDDGDDDGIGIGSGRDAERDDDDDADA